MRECYFLEKRKSCFTLGENNVKIVSTGKEVVVFSTSTKTAMLEAVMSLSLDGW